MKIAFEIIERNGPTYHVKAYQNSRRSRVFIGTYKGTLDQILTKIRDEKYFATDVEIEKEKWKGDK